MSKLAASTETATGGLSLSPASSPAGHGDEAVKAADRPSPPPPLENRVPTAAVSRKTGFLPHTPASPPLTAYGSQVDQGHVIARPNAFTPPDSAPMSAEPSQNPSYTSNEQPKPEDAASIAVTVAETTFGGRSQGSTSMLDSADPQSKRPALGDDVKHKQPIGTQLPLDWTFGTQRPFYKTDGISHQKMNKLFSQDLFDVFGIRQIAADVARYHTVTGEKNPLRKTYQNFIKDISGKNKPTAQPQELTDLLGNSEEDGNDQMKEELKIEPEMPASLLAKLEKAVQMESGRLNRDESDKWKSVLDLDEAPANPSPWPQTQNNYAQSKPVLPINPTSGFEPPRVSRRDTKRRYDEDSFEGYGEGYIDDVVDSPDADPDDDDRRNAGKKKRRRVSTSRT